MKEKTGYIVIIIAIIFAIIQAIIQVKIKIRLLNILENENIPLEILSEDKE